MSIDGRAAGEVTLYANTGIPSISRKIGPEWGEQPINVSRRRPTVWGKDPDRIAQ